MGLLSTVAGAKTAKVKYVKQGKSKYIRNLKALFPLLAWVCKVAIIYKISAFSFHTKKEMQESTEK